MTVTIYLAGAMDYVGDYAIHWRKSATSSLNLIGYKVLDPTSIPEDYSMSPEEIAQKNLFMQKKSDILLVEYMLENRAYIGTDYEMAWAKMHDQPVIVMCSDQNKDRPYMRYMATKITKDLEEAIDYISVHYPSN
jgi:nucleoside 2-deoxyribosyltransferase